MSRIVWNETLDGWFGGPYQIELAAPRLWVLSRRPSQPSLRGPILSEVVRTSGSLQALKQAADELERCQRARRRLLTHITFTGAVLAAMAIALLAGAQTVAVVLLTAAFVVGLRTLVLWIEEATGSAWAVVSKHYQ
jgi:hypothetical protein